MAGSGRRNRGHGDAHPGRAAQAEWIIFFRYPALEVVERKADILF